MPIEKFAIIKWWIENDIKKGVAKNENTWVLTQFPNHLWEVWHWMEVRPNQALDLLLRDGRHRPSTLQHHSNTKGTPQASSTRKYSPKSGFFYQIVKMNLFRLLGCIKKKKADFTETARREKVSTLQTCLRKAALILMIHSHFDIALRCILHLFVCFLKGFFARIMVIWFQA